MEKRLLNVDDAAEMLGVRPSTVRAWILQRRIPFVKLGRRVFLQRDALERLITDSIIPAQK